MNLQLENLRRSYETRTPELSDEEKKCALEIVRSIAVRGIVSELDIAKKISSDINIRELRELIVDYGGIGRVNGKWVVNSEVITELMNTKIPETKFLSRGDKNERYSLNLLDMRS